MFWPLLVLYALLAWSHMRLSSRLDAVEDRLRELEKRSALGRLRPAAQTHRRGGSP